MPTCLRSGVEFAWHSHHIQETSLEASDYLESHPTFRLITTNLQRGGLTWIRRHSNLRAGRPIATFANGSHFYDIKAGVGQQNHCWCCLCLNDLTVAVTFLSQHDLRIKQWKNCLLCLNTKEEHQIGDLDRGHRSVTSHTLTMSFNLKRGRKIPNRSCRERRFQCFQAWNLPCT